MSDIDISDIIAAVRELAAGGRSNGLVQMIGKQALLDLAADCMEALRARNAEPVKHGRWIKTDNGIRINQNTREPIRTYLCDCSCCGWYTGNQGTAFKFCPNCGAKMDGGNGNETD